MANGSGSAKRAKTRSNSETMLIDELDGYISIHNSFLESKKPVEIEFNFDGLRRTVDLLKLSEEDLDFMSKNFDESYFSLHNQKTFDNTVRQSKSTKNFNCLFETAHLDSLFFYKKAIVPYKVNLYEPGSFFDFHTDTKTSFDHWGTLILIPLTEYEGGGLNFEHTSINLKPPAGSLSCVHFPLHVKHKVEPVESGRRVSVVFKVQTVENEIEEDFKSPFIKHYLEAQKQAVSDPSTLIEKIHDYYKDRKNILLLVEEYDPEFVEALLLRFGEKCVKVNYDLEDQYAYASDSICLDCDSDNSCHFDFRSLVEMTKNDYKTRYKIEDTFLNASRFEGECIRQECRRLYGYRGNSPCSSTYSFEFYGGYMLNPEPIPMLLM